MQWYNGPKIRESILNLILKYLQIKHTEIESPKLIVI